MMIDCDEKFLFDGDDLDKTMEMIIGGKNNVCSKSTKGDFQMFAEDRVNLDFKGDFQIFVWL